MVKIAYLSWNKYRRKYNDVLRKKLDAAGIQYKEISKQWGDELWVSETDHSKAARIVLSVSLTNPKY